MSLFFQVSDIVYLKNHVFYICVNGLNCQITQKLANHVNVHHHKLVSHQPPLVFGRMFNPHPPYLKPTPASIQKFQFRWIVANLTVAVCSKFYQFISYRYDQTTVFDVIFRISLKKHFTKKTQNFWLKLTFTTCFWSRVPNSIYILGIQDVRENHRQRLTRDSSGQS